MTGANQRLRGSVRAEQTADQPTGPWHDDRVSGATPDAVEIHCTEPLSRGYDLVAVRNRVPVAEFAFVSTGWDAVGLAGPLPDTDDELVVYVGSEFRWNEFAVRDPTTLPPAVVAALRTQHARVLDGVSGEFTGIDTPSRRLHVDDPAVVGVAEEVAERLAPDPDPWTTRPGTEVLAVDPPDRHDRGRVGDVRGQARRGDGPGNRAQRG